MKEAELQKAVIETAHLFGYLVAHFRPARTQHGWATPVAADGKGYPDLTLARPGRLVFVELKVGYNKLSADQEKWITALRAAGAEMYVWTERDWVLGTIEEVLR